MPHHNSTENIILDLSNPPFAVVTLNMPKKKNALNGAEYKKLSSLLQVRD